VISGFKHLANKKTLGNQHLTTTSSVTTEIQGEYSSVVTLVKKGLDLRGFFHPHNSSGIVPTKIRFKDLNEDLKRIISKRSSPLIQ
jgi:hypothetical protein